MYFALTQKKKKAIVAELKFQQNYNYMYNVSSFIQDLRDDKNVGQVTKKDIKVALKAKKKNVN